MCAHQTNFKQMRREWLFLETMLFSHQAQRAQGISQATSATQQQRLVRLQAQIMQLHLEEQALERDNLLLFTAGKWQELFEIQVQEPEDPEAEPKAPEVPGMKKHRPKLPQTMREWEMLADSALGLSYTKPFVPSSFSFSW